MAEVIIQGQKFRIKGDEPTQKETLAIETYLSGKKQNTNFNFDKELELMVKPEDILTDAEKGKYNKDTESFLRSPTFFRLVSEVGLSIAGGIAGAALAPVTGGGSLVAAGALAARTARLVRPLLNISSNTMQKIGYATAGAGIGGATGAGIAQTFDPRESIVKEVARGAAQGAFGEVLGFGLAGGLSKVYNKITKGTIDTITGAERATQILARDKEFFKVLREIDQSGKQLSDDAIEQLTKKKSTKGDKKLTKEYGDIEIEGITAEQAAILKDPKRTQEMITNINKRTPTFFKDIEKANITPGFLTQNNAVNFISNVGRTALIGSGVVRTAEQTGKMATLNGIDVMVESLLKTDIQKGLGKMGADFSGFDEFGNAVGKLIQDGVTKNRNSYDAIKDKLWQDLSKQIDETIKLPDGTYNPAFDVIIQNAPKQLKVLRGKGVNKVEEITSSLDDYIGETITAKAIIRNTDEGRSIFEMTDLVGGLKDRANFNDFRSVYGAISRMRFNNGASAVQAEIMKRMEAMMANSPLPPTLNNLRTTASQFTSFGSQLFRDTTLKKILNNERGIETVYKQIVASGKEDYYDVFFKTLDESRTTINGKQYDLFPNRTEIKAAVRGQFLTDYLKNSVSLKGQYPTLTNTQAQKFLNQHRFLLKKDGFLSGQQVKNLEDYTDAMKIYEGKIKNASEAGSNPMMFMQLNAAGAFSQGLGLFMGATGNFDPGTAAFFVAGPLGIAQMIASPRFTNLLIKGLGGKGLTIDSTQKMTRYFSQLASAGVDEGIFSAEEATSMMNEIEGNKSKYDQFFKTGILEGAQGEMLPNPEEAPAIEVTRNRSSNVMNTAVPIDTSNIPLPSITPSNLPIGGQPNTELAQALNLFNKGGIVSAKKNF
jgi:hypothetical protein